MSQEHDEPAPPDLSGAQGAVEEFLLGAQPHLTRVEIAEAAGVSTDVAQELWRLLGFPQSSDDEQAFTDADVEALRLADELTGLGILGADSQAALVRTWGRSFARLAEWQVTLLARVAAEVPGADPAEQLATLAAEVLPRVDQLQSYVWRRHLLSAAGRMLGAEPGAETTQQAVCFCDIVGFTSQSKRLKEHELVGWIETFEESSADVVLAEGGRVIKNIGDEVLLVADDPAAAARIALALVARGEDPEDPFPEVRAGVAYGEVVTRLGDVLGPTVNIAARLTSLARPGTVLVDDGLHDALAEDESFRWRRLQRASVKGYSRLQPWVLRPSS